MNHPVLRTAYAAMIAGENNAAAQILREGLVSEPNNAELWRMLADVLQAAGDLPGALDAITNSLRVDPGAMANIQHKAELEKLIDETPSQIFDTPPPILSNPDLTSNNESPAYHSTFQSPYQRPLEVNRATDLTTFKTPIKEPIWTNLGIGIAIGSFLLGLSYLLFIMKVVLDSGSDPTKIMANMSAFSNARQRDISLFMFAGMAQTMMTLLWMSFDCVSRRRPILWQVLAFVLSVPCCLFGVFGPGWFLIPLYMAVGRKDSR